MNDRDRLLLWIAGGAGLAALLFSQRNTLMIYGSKALDAANAELFKLSLPTNAQPYSEIIRRVASEQGIDPFVIYAIGERESRWGEAIGGPAGTGDNDHGHGLMQIDDGSFASWLASHDWTDPYTNVTKGVQILKAKMAFLSTTAPVAGLTDGVYVTVSASQAAKRKVQPGSYSDPRPLQGSDLLQAAISAYNTGEGNVLISLAVGVDPDATTAHANYSSDVVSNANDTAAAFNAKAA